LLFQPAAHGPPDRGSRAWRGGGCRF
jgi:hypothetical protein